MAKRPGQVPRRVPLSLAQIARAEYVGSEEHKADRWWGGLPKAYVGVDGEAKRPNKQKTTICHLVTETDRQKATGWVRAALMQRQFKYLEGDKDFPARIWYREPGTGQLWIGYCLNGILGQYKGWPGVEDDLEIFS
jgi:hypothetical protein